MNLIKELEKFNLSASESKMYIAALELGPAAVQQMAARAKLHRVSAYGVIKSLIEKGFLREELVNKKHKIVAYPPMKLYDIIGQRQEQLRRQERLLETLVPELKRVIKITETGKPNIIYYEGPEGLKNWASDVLDATGEILEWTRIEAFIKPFEDYLQAYYFPEKFKRQISTRFLFVDTPEARQYAQENYIKNKQASPMKARFVPFEEFPTNSFMVIYGNRFSIAIPSESRAVTVVDPFVADFQRKIFEFGWQHAKDEIQNKPYPFNQKKR